MIAPGFGLVHAGDDLDQRALAAPVLAGEAQDLARHDVEANIVERLDAAKLLGDMFDLQQGNT